MARKQQKGKRRPNNFRRFTRARYCKFTAAGVEQIDYKDLATLKEYISEA